MPVHSARVLTRSASPAASAGARRCRSLPIFSRSEDRQRVNHASQKPPTFAPLGDSAWGALSPQTSGVPESPVWNELPDSAFDVEISGREDLLKEEALNLFNRLKPELVLFKGDVVSYQFTDWGGDFTYERTPVNQFLEETADRLCYLRHLEMRFKKLRIIAVGALSGAAYLVTLWLLLPWVPDVLALPATVVMLPLPLALDRWLSRRLQRMPQRIIDDGRLEGIGDGIRALQTRLAEIRGSRPDPLRAQRLGRAVLSELRESMSDEEIEGFARRLRSQLFVVPRQYL